MVSSGGAERALLDFIASSRLVDLRPAFHLLTFAREAPCWLLPLDSEPPLAVSELPDGRLSILGDSGARITNQRLQVLKLSVALMRAGSSTLHRYLRALRAEVARASPDIIHSNGIKAHLLAGLICPSTVPLIWHMHDFVSDRPLVRRAMRLVPRRPSAIIAVSSSVAADRGGELPWTRYLLF